MHVLHRRLLFLLGDVFFGQFQQVLILLGFPLLDRPFLILFLGGRTHAVWLDLDGVRVELKLFPACVGLELGTHVVVGGGKIVIFGRSH